MKRILQSKQKQTEFNPLHGNQFLTKMDSCFTHPWEDTDHEIITFLIQERLGTEVLRTLNST